MNSLLPPSSSLFEQGIESAVSRVGAIDVSPAGELFNPATCPAALLPWLAWAIEADPWNTAWTVAQQRAAIAASIQVHRTRGTVGALKRALEAIGYEVNINEQTGEAYVFRVEIDASVTGLTNEAVYADAVTISLRTKPARSFFGGADGLLRATLGPIFACAAIGGTETEVFTS
jgi:phage tail P2-like protein